MHTPRSLLCLVLALGTAACSLLAPSRDELTGGEATSGGSGGAAGTAGSETGGIAGTSGAGGSLPCEPDREDFTVADGSGNLDTTGPICLRICNAPIGSWQCNNMDDREVYINNVLVECPGSLGVSPIDDCYYFDISEGSQTHANFSVW